MELWLLWSGIILLLLGVTLAVFGTSKVKSLDYSWIPVALFSLFVIYDVYALVKVCYFKLPLKKLP